MSMGLGRRFGFGSLFLTGKEEAKMELPAQEEMGAKCRDTQDL